MSATVDQFCDRLRDRVTAIEGRIQTFRVNVQGLSEKAEQALRDKLEEARSRLQAEKERAEQARANLKARAQQKIAETKEAVSEWKAKREARKLKARAEWAEAYAADAISNAVTSIDEAEEAILDAVLARIDADEGK